LERAKVHKREFAEIWNDFLHRDGAEPYVPFVSVDPDGKGVICIDPDPAFPKEELSLQFGEMLYQLRAALDSLVYEVAILDSGEDPPPDPENLEFPIRPSKSSFQNAARKIEPLSDFHREMVESVQPYDVEKRAEGHRIAAVALQELNDLARKDRHRGLRVIASWISNKNPQFDLSPGCDIEWLSVTPDGLLDHEGEIVSFQISNWRPGLHFEANPNCAIDVTVEDAPPPTSDEDTMDERAATMIAVVTLVIEGFEETFD
jgi:hypothetical protein